MLNGLRKWLASLPHGGDDPRIVEYRRRSDKADDLARQIRIAVEGAGFDPEMLDVLPASYVAAALTLGIK